MRIRVVGWVGLAALLPGVVAAQGRVVVTPYLGMYMSIGSLIDEGGSQLGQFAQVPALRKRQVGTGLVGLRVLLRATTRLGLETMFGFSPSMVAVTDARSTTDHSGPVLLAGARAWLQLTEARATPWSFHVAAGPGLVHRAGATWNQTSGTTDLAAIVGVGATLRSTDRLSFRLEIEDFVSRAAFFTRTHGETTARLHQDLVWSMGGAFLMGKR